MNPRKLHWIWILFFPFFFSCNAKTETKIDLEKVDQLSLFEVFSEAKVVLLETNTESLISNIAKVIFHQGYFYIFDSHSNSVFCFDEQGRFIFKIDSEGKGKGEYNKISDINIDKQRNQILLLDPVMQKVFYFDTKGAFQNVVSIQTEQNMGFQRVHALNADTLMLISRDNAFVFFSISQDRIVYSAYPLPASLPMAFYPRHHVYQIHDRTYALPPFGNMIFDFTEIKPVPFYELDFGKNNNTKEQIDELFKQFELWKNSGKVVFTSSQIAGPGKWLNHYVLMVNETTRFRLALIEFNNNFKNLVIDKNTGKTYVFESFTEGTILPWANIRNDMAIAFYNPPLTERDRMLIKIDGLEDYYFNRNHKKFLLEIFTTEDQKKLENFNPMTDNPFLVVYKFRK